MYYFDKFAKMIIESMKDTTTVQIQQITLILALSHVAAILHLEIKSNLCISDATDSTSLNLLPQIDQFNECLKLLELFKSKWWYSAASFFLFKTVIDKDKINMPHIGTRLDGNGSSHTTNGNNAHDIVGCKDGNIGGDVGPTTGGNNVRGGVLDTSKDMGNLPDIVQPIPFPQPLTSDGLVSGGTYTSLGSIRPTTGSSGVAVGQSESNIGTGIDTIGIDRNVGGSVGAGEAVVSHESFDQVDKNNIGVVNEILGMNSFEKTQELLNSVFAEGKSFLDLGLGHV
ncbi:unnamed protein product [Ambrosiozyma monospora]|uniref:Unnamed protein product n=1 Tax=Ambrosiozyma monospora TaxID=43982 RepID=A0ACB5T3E6_AMBMO|nr:unnamed protein product [Ambrosiozyma monospora]